MSQWTTMELTDSVKTKRVRRNTMNEAFFQLTGEKQERIMNAAMEVFSRYEYKRASTDDIAAKAGISKGLLFYYFHNKRELYLYLFHYCKAVVTEQIISVEKEKITDFFELLQYGARKKSEIMERNPYIMDFSIRAFYSEQEVISEDVKKEIGGMILESYETYFKELDYYKFKEGIDPQYLIKMLYWMADGYIHEKQRMSKSVSMEEIMHDFNKWAGLFKKMSYREEYLI